MNGKQEIQEIFSKKVRAGRRTYFFDVRSTKAEDYYMTITESIKDTNDEGIASYRKHKIYLYKEDFRNFEQAFKEVSQYKKNGSKSKNICVTKTGRKPVATPPSEGNS